MKMHNMQQYLKPVLSLHGFNSLRTRLKEEHPQEPDNRPRCLRCGCVLGTNNAESIYCTPCRIGEIDIPHLDEYASIADVDDELLMRVADLLRNDLISTTEPGPTLWSLLIAQEAVK